MIPFLLTTCLCIYELVVYHQKKASWFLSWIGFSTASLLSVYFFPWCFVIWIYIAYLTHHHFLLNEEKIYAVLLTGITAAFLCFRIQNDGICLGWTAFV